MSESLIVARPVPGRFDRLRQLKDRLVQRVTRVVEPYVNKAKAIWEEPKLKWALGTIQVIAGPALLLAAGGALAAHLTGIKILGDTVSLKRVTILLASSATTTLAGLKMREEATATRKKRAREANPPVKPDVERYEDLGDLIARNVDHVARVQDVRELKPQKDERIAKGFALVAGALLLGLFAYQVHGLVTGASKLEADLVSHLAAVGILATSLGLIAKFLLREKRDLGEEIPEEIKITIPEATPKEVAPPTKIRDALIRKLPKGLGIGGTVFGGSALALAAVGLGLLYGGKIDHFHLLNGHATIDSSMINQVAQVGKGIGLPGITMLVGSASAAKLREEDQKRAELEEEIESLRKTPAKAPEIAPPRLKGDQLHLTLAIADARVELDKLEGQRLVEKTAGKTRHTALKVISLVAVGASIAFLAWQASSLVGEKFDLSKHTVTMVTMGGSAVGLTFFAGGMLQSARGDREHREMAALEAEKRAEILKHYMGQVEQLFLSDS